MATIGGRAFAFGMGAFLLLGCIIGVDVELSQRRDWQAVPGLVVLSHDGSGYGFAIVEFRDSHGNHRKTNARTVFHSAGDKVVVRYDPKNPDRTNVGYDGWVPLACVAALGLAAIFLGTRTEIWRPG
jgi:hypothetical protein